MDRVRGLFSLVLITACVMGVLRVAHVSIPMVFPETRQGPIDVASLDEVRRLAGFAPLLPAYRPALLGEQPSSMTFTYHPQPTVVTVWRAGGQYLSVPQQKGGPMPDHPPLAQPLAAVPGSRWWSNGDRSQVILGRGAFWILIDTSLPARELTRFVDTLTPY